MEPLHGFRYRVNRIRSYFILIASISMESVASGGSKDGGMEIGEWVLAMIWTVKKGLNLCH